MLKKYFKNINKKSCTICFIITLVLVWALQYLAINFNGGNAFAKFWTTEFRSIDSGSLQIIIISILTMFIPVAINFLNVEAKIIKWALISRVLYVKELTIYSVIILVVLAIFSVTPIIIILLTCYLGWIFIKPMSSLWEWFDKMDMTYLFEFFKGLTVKKEDRQKIIDSYSSLWTDKDLITENNEKEFTEIFIKHVDKAFENNDYELAVELCDGYLKNIENRSKLSIFLLFKNVFKWIDMELQYNFNNVDMSSVGICFRVNFFRNIFLKTLFKILLRGDFERYSFRIISDYADRMNQEIAQAGNKGKQLNDRLSKVKNTYKRLFRILFDNSIKDIPGNWKITRQVLEEKTKKEDIIIVVMLKIYFEFVQKRIKIKSNSNFDEKLENVTNNLFLNKTPRIFAIAVMFVIGQIEAPRNFGLIDVRNEPDQIKSTFELLKLLGIERLNKNKLKKEQKELGDILKDRENDNKQDVDTINRIKETLEFIGKYLKFLESKK